MAQKCYWGTFQCMFTKYRNNAMFVLNVCSIKLNCHMTRAVTSWLHWKIGWLAKLLKRRLVKYVKLNKGQRFLVHAIFTAQPFPPPPLQPPLLLKRQHPLATRDKSKELLLVTRRAGQRGQSEEPAGVSRFSLSRRPTTTSIPEYKVYSPNAAECVKQRCPYPSVWSNSPTCSSERLGPGVELFSLDCVSRL